MNLVLDVLHKYSAIKSPAVFYFDVSFQLSCLIYDICSFLCQVLVYKDWLTIIAFFKDVRDLYTRLRTLYVANLTFTARGLEAGYTVHLSHRGWHSRRGVHGPSQSPGVALPSWGTRSISVTGGGTPVVGYTVHLSHRGWHSRRGVHGPSQSPGVALPSWGTRSISVTGGGTPVVGYTVHLSHRGWHSRRGIDEMEDVLLDVLVVVWFFFYVV